MEFKGTKTPWVKDGNLIFAEDHFQTHICQVSESFNNETREANARLIAAAPELLAACQEFVRKCECGEARSKRSYSQMKDAIAKALGKEADDE